LNKYPKVSIITVNWNGSQILYDFLQNICEIDYSNLEIIVVDNNSTDNSINIINQFPNIKLIRLKKNTGFACGNNIGIKHSTGDFVLLLNTDTFCKKNIITQFLNSYDNKNYDKIAGIIPLVLLKNNNINSFGSIFYHDFHPFNIGFNKNPDTFNFEKYKNKIIGFYGAAIFLNKQMFNDIGYMDEEYFLYHEETDLALRARINNWKFIINENIKVKHLHSFSSKSLSLKKIYFCERNRIFNLIKYGTKFQIIKSFYYSIKRYLNSNENNLHTAEKNVNKKNYFLIFITLIFSYISVVIFLDTLIFKRMKFRNKIKIQTYDL
jgi:hypothetical protein